MWRVVVCDQETSNEEAKARYGAVKNTTKRVVTPRKQTVNCKNVVLKPQVHANIILVLLTRRMQLAPVA